MIIALIAGIGLVLICGLIALLYRFRKKQSQLQENLEEYKALFETADSLQRQGEIQIEFLNAGIEQRNLTLDRGAQALDLAKSKVDACEDALITRNEEVSKLTSSLGFQESQYSKLLSQKKSSEVRTGKITEQISPFLKDYPLNPSTARFIGDPIDFIHFDDDKVTFVEVKSGKSQLSKKQRHIRDLIAEGKVEFTVYRVEGK